jgi:hypothetical protein
LRLRAGRLPDGQQQRHNDRSRQQRRTASRHRDQPFRAADPPYTILSDKRFSALLAERRWGDRNER